jgi:hypothetical protein
MTPINAMGPPHRELRAYLEEIIRLIELSLALGVGHLQRLYLETALSSARDLLRRADTVASR